MFYTKTAAPTHLTQINGSASVCHKGLEGRKKRNPHDEYLYILCNCVFFFFLVWSGACAIWIIKLMILLLHTRDEKAHYLLTFRISAGIRELHLIFLLWPSPQTTEKLCKFQIHFSFHLLLVSRCFFLICQICVILQSFDVKLSNGFRLKSMISVTIFNSAYRDDSSVILIYLF